METVLAGRGRRVGSVRRRERWLTAVPESAAFVDTRGLLLEGAELFGDRHGFVAVRQGGLLLAAFGRPGPGPVELALALADPEAELVATGEAVPHLRRLLGFAGWRAWIHALAESERHLDAELPEAVLLPPEAPVEHFSREFRREIADVRGRRPIGAVMEGKVPVSICYPTLVTERYWDVSIETVDGFQRGGRATAAFLHTERELHEQGLAPVWGAAVDNTASLALAKKLGFVPIGELTVFDLSARDD